MDDFKAKMVLEDIYDGVQRYHCLKLIYELGVHDILNNNPIYLSAEQICKEIKVRDIIPAYLQRVLRYLACFDIIDEKYHENENNIVVFKTTNILNHLKKVPTLKQEKFCPRIIDIVDKSSENYNFHSEIVLNGRSLWQYMEDTPSYKEHFNKRMQSHTSDNLADIPKIADIINNENQSNAHIVDLGGNTGQMVKLLSQQISTLKCTNFDLEEIIKSNQPLANVEMVAGDMFKVKSMPSADIFFTKNVLHDWSDKQCIQLMRNMSDKLKKDGVVISVNYILPEPGKLKDLWWSRSMDVTLLMMFGKGRTRTLSEFHQLHQAAGFNITKTINIGHEEKPTMVLVARKIENV